MIKKIVWLLSLLACAPWPLMAQSYFRTDYPSVWQRTAEYTLEVAAAMPAEKYDFRPAPESMTFRRQMVHIAQNLAFLSDKITGERPDFLDGKEPDLLTREEVSTLLNRAFDHVARLIRKIDDNTLHEQIEFRGETMTKENIFYLMRNHVTHHRAQAIVYLRMNDADIPGYRGW